MSPDDFRANNPRFVRGNFEQNMRIVHAVEMVAAEVAGTPAQVTLAWLFAQGDDIVPIPGAKHVSSSAGGPLRGHVQDQPVGSREG